jgi:threonine dehydratase
VSERLSALAREAAAKTRTISERLHRHAIVTALTGWAAATEETGTEILLKCEHQQKTGSFKVRGALAKLLSLSDEQRDRGVVTASTGNHGLGVAHALCALGGTGLVCVPEHASPVKVAAIRRYGVEVRVLGANPLETENRARLLAAEAGMSYISPYNDLDVIAGQGTVGEEILEQLDGRPVDAVVVAVGGGGLISGIGASVKSVLPGVRLIGASPVNDAAMAASVRAGEVTQVDARPTISDGTAGGIEEGSITLPLCAELVDEWVLVTEPEIHSALRFMIDTQHQLIEGAAAMAIAAALKTRRGSSGGATVIVSCGANISSTALAEALLSAHLGGRRLVEVLQRPGHARAPALAVAEHLLQPVRRRGTVVDFRDDRPLAIGCELVDPAGTGAITDAVLVLRAARAGQHRLPADAAVLLVLHDVVEYVVVAHVVVVHPHAERVADRADRRCADRLAEHARAVDVGVPRGIGEDREHPRGGHVDPTGH